ncbi:MAG: trimethylamine corrinoid protein 2 [Armatimonadota bacterium]
MTMPIEHIPDWETRLARQDAFWNGEIIDRVTVSVTVPKKEQLHPWPKQKSYSDSTGRWMDTEYIVECAIASSMNTDYLGDALPHFWPNLGPEVFSAFFGCELGFGDYTSWSIPNLEDWADVDKIKFSKDNFYFKKINEITDALLDAGKGRFYTGITDLHPGGDGIAAFRDPLNLNIDMIEYPDEVKKLLEYINQTYFMVYDHFCDKLISSGQAVSSWAGIVSTKRWYVPSNDFSCMISKRMFDDVFLPGIAEECRHTEASVYHLDGPGALRHLDSLLEIPELNAIQWVYGEGNGRASDWLHVYKKCQAAGKSLQIGMQSDEIDIFMENLSPKGVWVGLSGVADKEHAESVIDKLSQWR